MEKRNLKLTTPQLAILGVQHMFAMFGATVLVPALTGLNPSVALFTSAIGTLIFHLVTGGKVPAYLGSSFAFISPIIAASDSYGVQGALLGCFVAGLVYIVCSFIIRAIGTDFIDRFLPPVVVGPVIMTIGLLLAPVAKDMASTHLLTAFFTLAVAITVSIFGKGLFKVIPILMAIISGYIFAIFNGLVNFAPISTAKFLAFPDFTFLNPMSIGDNLGAIIIIAPIAIVTMVEHLGDVLAISNTTGQEFIKDPGLHRTLLGDGIATALAGIFGGPPNTTYGENVGVLAITKVYNPLVVRVAACFVLILSFIPKVGALIQSIPAAVMGGICILLFGMIASIGLRTLVENTVDLSNTRNLVIVSTILVIGLSGIEIPIGEIAFGKVGLAAIVGILLNLVLPKDKDQTEEQKEALAEVAATK